MLIFFILDTIHYDALGNVVGLTNSLGAPIQTYTYTAFGEIVSQTGTTLNPYQFSTKHYNPTTGLVHFEFRYYNPTVGRFITQDPLGMVNGPNLYVYVNNDPLNWIDPWGLCIKTRWWPKWLDIFVPGYRNYGGPSRSGPGLPEDLMDVAFQRHDIGYQRGELEQADLQLIYDLSNLPANPREWGEEVNVVYARAYRAGAYVIFSTRLVIIQIGRDIREGVSEMRNGLGMTP